MEMALLMVTPLSVKSAMAASLSAPFIQLSATARLYVTES